MLGDARVRVLVVEHRDRLARFGAEYIEAALAYKAAMGGTRVVVADRWFPSSKKCSTPGCPVVLAVLPLSVREWTCPGCGVTHDRDFNAACNLRDLAASSTDSNAHPEGTREDSAGRRKTVKLASEKQELSHVLVGHG